MDELRPAECRTLKCAAEVEFNCNAKISCLVMELVNSSIWRRERCEPNKFFNRKGIKTRRISRAVISADCLASHNSSQDLYRAVVQMGGMWLGARLDDYAGFYLQFSCTQRVESEVPVPSKVPIRVSLQCTPGFHAMVV